MQNDDALKPCPCPTCKQYSHTLRTDEIGEAILHFETMIQLDHKSYPTLHAFDDKTRDMAQRLVAALTAQADEIERLRVRLEITDEITERYDGIACRDETIRLLEQKIAALKAAQEVKA